MYVRFTRENMVGAQVEGCHYMKKSPAMIAHFQKRRTF